MTIQPQTQFSNHAASYSYCRIGLRFGNRIGTAELSTGMPACGRTVCHLGVGSVLDGAGSISILNPIMEHTMHTLCPPARMSHAERMNLPAARVHVGIPLTGFGPRHLYRVGIVTGESSSLRAESLWIYTAGGMERATTIAETRYPLASGGWRITHLQRCQRIGIPPRKT